MGIFSLIKPLRHYIDYVYRAHTYDSLFMINKAIKVMEDAVNQPFTKEEISSGFIYLGRLYAKTKQYQKASDAFHQGLELMKNATYKYSPNFKLAIQTFIRAGDQQRAVSWLDHLLERQKDDKAFKRLLNFKHIID